MQDSIMNISIVIRTYNEEKHLGSLLKVIKTQNITDNDIEVIVVDSGSTDKTLHIAGQYGCHIIHISSEEFSFGRSLNIGCTEASNDILVFISGHCIPVDNYWLYNLIKPLLEGKAIYSYGRQIGNHESSFSECQIFRKYYSEKNKITQEDYFCNNANAALQKSTWEQYKFNEELTGLEDMELGKRLINAGQKLAYVADAPVYHIHNESWKSVRNRYEREAIALQRIAPEIQISFLDFLRYYISAILLDIGTAIQEKIFVNTLGKILLFRLMQFWGSYRGNHEHRKLSKEMKEKYFYPK
jgi:glycosyltransferase involved in cell wall biosynthesis